MYIYLYKFHYMSEATMAKELTSLSFNHLTLASLAMVSNPGHDYMWDTQRSCPVMTSAVEIDVKTPILPCHYLTILISRCVVM